jgi:hypothetical protein
MSRPSRLPRWAALALAAAPAVLAGCSPGPPRPDSGGAAPARLAWDWDGLPPWNWGDAKAKPPPGRDPTAPILSIAVNGAGAAETFQGWPLVVQARLLHPRAYETGPDIAPLTLTAREGPWPSAVRLEVVNVRGEAVAWPFRAEGPADAALTLGPAAGADLAWQLTPEQTEKIAEGDYRVVAVLEAASRAGAWKGTVRSPAVPVAVRKEPSPLSPPQDEEKHLLLAGQAVLAGDGDAALWHVDQLLARQPRSIGGLAFKADVLTAVGRKKEALRLYEQAVDAFYEKHPDAEEPPGDLLMKWKTLFYELNKPK